MSASPRSKKLASVSSAVWVDITTVTQCTSVTVGEDRSVAGYPSVRLMFRFPDAVGDIIEVWFGEQFQIPAPGIFFAGVKVGEVKTKSGTTDLQQFEGG